jgi:hypothetical protein
MAFLGKMICFQSFRSLLFDLFAFAVTCLLWLAVLFEAGNHIQDLPSISKIQWSIAPVDDSIAVEFPSNLFGLVVSKR